MEQYADMLSKQGWTAAAYHAGMSGDEVPKGDRSDPAGTRPRHDPDADDPNRAHR